MLRGGPVGEVDRGAGAVLVIALVAVGMVLAGALAVLAQGHGASARARAAADLAALAGATVVSVPAGLTVTDPDAERAACAVAGTAAEHNGAVVVACELRGAVVTVTTAVAGPLGPQRATAAAGPRP